MPHTQERTARDLVGKLITFMETGRPGWQPRSRGPDPDPDRPVRWILDG